MKPTGYIIIAMLALAGCSNSDEVKKLTEQNRQDSALLVQANEKDSNVSSYLSAMSQIQDNLDRIKTREKMISVKSGEKGTDKQSVVAEVKELDEWIVANDKKMTSLQARLKTMTTKNANLADIVMHLSQEISMKDTEIYVLQNNLSQSYNALQTVNANFDDSISVIYAQRAQVANLTTQLNTVYYVTGTMRQLKDNGIIDKEGGFIGIGRTSKVNPDIDNSKYTQVNLTTFKGMTLNGKFKKFITIHPDNSYTITSDDKSDYVSITNPASFWGESKYMVIALK